MIRFLATLALVAALVGCSSSIEQDSPGHVWRASDENGDKPGIGYALINDNGKISGEAYIIDADHPHDFSHARRAAMKVVEQSPKEITFRVQWDKDLKATLRFDLKQTDWPDSFEAVVSEIISSEAYDSETYTFVKSK